MITFTRDWRGYAKGSSVSTLADTIEALAVAEGAAIYGGVAGPLNSYLDADNRVQAQVDAGGKAQVLMGTAPTLPVRGYPVLSGIRAADALSVVNATVTDVSRVAPDGTLLQGIRVTATGASTNASIDLALRSNTFANGRLSLLAYQDPSALNLTTQPGVAWSLADGVGFANWLTTGPVSWLKGWWGLHPAVPASNSQHKWTTGGGAPAFGSTAFTRVRLRLNYTTTEQPWMEFYEMNYQQDVAKSWVALTIDDGYDTAYTLGAPTLEKYGMRGSFSIIADLIGTAGYMTLPQLQDLVARGHEMVVHGPIGGTGSLANYSGSADKYSAVLADIISHQSYLVNNGLAKKGSERCYIYPQGYYQFSNADQTISNAVAALNMVGGRAAGTGIQTKRTIRGQGSLLLPIIGHTWTSTPSEAANITAIQASINAAATDKCDVTLMNHKFVTGAAAASLEIQVSNYELILQSIADNISAGTQEQVLFSELLFSTANVRRPAA